MINKSGMEKILENPQPQSEELKVGKTNPNPFASYDNKTFQQLKKEKGKELAQGIGMK